MFSEERKAEIIALIGQRGSIDVNMLAERFQTSRETIRRDLGDLERKGALKRTHGGAVAVAPASESGQLSESPVGERGVRQAEEKQSICRKAAAHIQPGDTIFIDNSSTMIYLPRYIPPEMNITILTNSIGFLVEAAKVPNYNWMMICLGGVFKPKNLSVHGSDTLKNAAPYYPVKTFISCSGVSAVTKIADSSIQELEIKRMMVERAQEVFLLADYTKFEKTGPIFLCNVEDVDVIISDDRFVIPPAVGALFQQSNVRLEIAERV